MSDHAREALVMSSIESLHRSSRSALDIRDGIHRLYEYQRGGDTSWTQGSLLERVLIPRGFTYVVAPACHPRFSPRFTTAAHDDCTCVRSLTGAPAGDAPSDDDTDDGYLIEGRLYVNVGTTLWRELVALGTLPETPTPRRLALAEVVAWVAEVAIEDEPELVLEWYRKPLVYLFRDDEPEPTRLTRARLEALSSARTLRALGLRASTALASRSDPDDEPDDDAPLSDEPEDDDEPASAETRALVEQLAARQRALADSPAGRVAAERDAWWRGELA